MKTFRLIFALFVSALSLSHADDGVLTAQPPVELTGTKGKFDFIKVDAANRRLLACHTGNGTLDVIDLDKSTLVKSIPTGNAQGVAIDEKGGRYFVSCSKPPQLIIIDSKTLDITGEVPLPEAADLCAYHSSANLVFIDDDEKPAIWVIDPNTKKIILMWPVKAGTGLEDLAISPDGTCLVQNVKDSSTIEWIATRLFTDSVAMGNVGQYFPTLPAENPHGSALLKDDTVLVAGGKGKLALINFKTGKVLASCDIALRVDEIAYDPESSRVYCASGTGTISVVFVTSSKLTPLPALTSAPGCHSIAVDPKTHSLWIAYVKGDKPCVQQFLSK